MRVIVTGSLAFDFIMDFPGKFSDHILPEKIHVINLSFLVRTMKKQRGGTAGNIAYNLALLGIKSMILATAGNDFIDYKKFLENVGVDTSMIRIIRAEPTASAFIFTDLADNQITGFYPGAMNYARRLSLDGALKVAPAGNFLRGQTARKKCSLGDSSKFWQAPRALFVVIAPNDPSAMIKYAEECQELKIPYLFDPGMQLPRLPDGDLRLGIEGAKIVIGNDYEIALIKKKIDTSDGGRLKAMTPPRWREKEQIWITTLGEKGSIIEVDSKTHKIPPAKPKEVLDPTGAGDAYRAGFLAGFLRGLPLDVCGKMGSVCACYTVEKYGTTTHEFTKSEFTRRYRENFNENLELPEV